jgi:hypothetical protein
VVATFGDLRSTSAQGFPQTVHTAQKFGDNFPVPVTKFVDNPVVEAMPPAVHFVLPEGAG